MDPGDGKYVVPGDSINMACLFKGNGDNIYVPRSCIKKVVIFQFDMHASRFIDPSSASGSIMLIKGSPSLHLRFSLWCTLLTDKKIR